MEQPSDQLLATFAPLRPVDDTGIVAHQAPDFFAIWAALEKKTGRECDVPFWATVWPGARLLARFLPEHPDSVCGKSVLDFGAGGAVAAIAAARAGARYVTACDIDPLACRVAAVNSAANGTDVHVDNNNLLAVSDPPVFDCIMLADMFYRKEINAPLKAFLRLQRQKGGHVLIADGNRPFAPRHGVEPIYGGRLTVDPAVEGCREREVTLYRMID